MRAFSSEEVDSSWHRFFESQIEPINSILSSLKESEIAPARENIFRAFRTPLESVKVVIIGQDPYPGDGVADGLAFSASRGTSIPASLRNIFLEYSDDLGLPRPCEPDLSPWSDEGVLLLNRTLTTHPGERNAHLDTGWKSLTLEIAKVLGARDVVAILWGNYARELAPYFTYRIESPHPSPLSARRGFFGSKPFSRTNEILVALGRDEINWKL